MGKGNQDSSCLRKCGAVDCCNHFKASISPKGCKGVSLLMRIYSYLWENCYVNDCVTDSSGCSMMTPMNGKGITWPLDFLLCLFLFISLAID